MTTTETEPGETYANPFDDTEDDAIEFICPELRIAPSDGKVTIIAGEPGAGKGPLAQHLGVCFALGEKAFGRFACKQSRVLLLDSEGLKQSKRRMRRYVRKMGRETSELKDWMCTRDVSGDNVVEDFQKIAEFVVHNCIDVLIFDAYTSAMLATGLNSDKPEWGTLAMMLGSLEITVIVVAHSRKLPRGKNGQVEPPTLTDVAGSFALASLAATAICVWHPERDNPDLIRVECLRAPEKKFGSFDLVFVDDVAKDALGLEIKTTAEVKQEVARAERIQASRDLNVVVEALRKSYMPLAINKIEELTGIHNRKLKPLMPALVEAEVVVREQHGSTFTYQVRDRQGQGSVTFDEKGKVVPIPPGGRWNGQLPRRTPRHTARRIEVPG